MHLIKVENFIFPILGIIYIVSLVFLSLEDETEQNPTLSVAFVAVFFSAYAYKCSKEKFRLDLQERRWILYSNLMIFCSFISMHGRFPYKNIKHEPDLDHQFHKALDAANHSFRGEGYHK